MPVSYANTEYINYVTTSMILAEGIGPRDEVDSNRPGVFRERAPHAAAPGKTTSRKQFEATF